MLKDVLNEIIKNKRLDESFDKVENLPFELDVANRVKVISLTNNSVSFIHRDKNTEKTFTLKRPRNKSWKNLSVNIGAKIKLKLTGGGKNRKPQLLVV